MKIGQKVQIVSNSFFPNITQMNDLIEKVGVIQDIDDKSNSFLVLGWWWDGEDLVLFQG